MKLRPVATETSSAALKSAAPKPSRWRSRLVAGVAFVVALALVGPIHSDAGAAQAVEVPSGQAAAAPVAVRQGDWILDETSRAVLSYEGTANIGSFQQDGLFTYGDYQYVAWFQADKRAAISRRALPDGEWQSFQLKPFLDIDDSHNVISMAVSPSDGRLHIVLGTHGGALRYFQSTPGLATDEAVPWAAESIGPEQLGFPGAAGTPTRGTYPVFETTASGELYFTFREGNTYDGRNQLIKYAGDAAGSWMSLGQYTGSTGTYTTEWGTSASRYAYLHGFVENPVTHDLTISWSWRERTSAWCSASGLGNHDLGFATSPDGGVTWQNNAGSVIGTTGTADQITVDDDHVVVPISINRGLINQESMAFDTEGRAHVITSQFNDADLATIGGCHTATYPQRAQYAKPFHHWRDAEGVWHTMELPYYNNSAGRSKLLFSADDTAYLVLPDARIAAATAASNWEDWQIVFEDPAVDNIAELIVDRTRLELSGILSVAYQEDSQAKNEPSPFRVADFSIDPTANPVARSTEPEMTPVEYDEPGVPTAEATSSQPGYPADLAVDGVRGTFWVSGGSAEGAGPQPDRPEVLTITYDEVQAINEVTVVPRLPDIGPKTFAIEALVDGAWVRLGEFTQPGEATAHTVPLTRTDSIRLVITAAYDKGRTPEKARNVQVAEVELTGTPDTTPPTSSATGPAISSSTDLQIAWTAAEESAGSGLAKVDLYATTPLDSEPTLVDTYTGADTEGSFAVEATAGDGSYVFFTVATDLWGNVESSADGADVETLVDTTAPVTVALYDETAASTGPVEVQLVATDDGSGVASIDYQVDGGEFVTYEGPISVSGAGQHAIAFHATDRAGNREDPQELALEIAPDPAEATPSETTLRLSSRIGLSFWPVTAYVTVESEADVEGLPVTVTVGTTTVDAVLDASGRASVRLPKLERGFYWVSASIAGTDVVETSSSRRTFVVFL